jgi:hypothetical protein
MQIYTGLDLSRNRLDWHALAAEGTLLDAGAVPPDPDGLAQLVRRLGDADVLAVLEVMNGARFVHDQLERSKAGTSGSPTRNAHAHSPPWPARPTGSTPGCWPNSPVAT